MPMRITTDAIVTAEASQLADHDADFSHLVHQLERRDPEQRRTEHRAGQRAFKPPSSKPDSRSPEVSPATMATRGSREAIAQRTMPRSAPARKASILSMSASASGA